MHIIFSHWPHMWHEIDQISTYSFFFFFFNLMKKLKVFNQPVLGRETLCFTLKKQNKPKNFLSILSKGKASQLQSKQLQNKGRSASVFTVSMPLWNYIHIYFPFRLLWKILPPSRKPDRAKGKNPQKTPSPSESQNIVERQKQVEE